MARGMTRREFATVAATLAAFGFDATAEGAATKTLRFIPGSDLRVLDPIWTTAGITRNHGGIVTVTGGVQRGSEVRPRFMRRQPHLATGRLLRL
jgi:peptide/nickel transport system substrate-binding protein